MGKFQKGDTRYAGWNKREIAWSVEDNGCWNCTSHKPGGTGYPTLSRNHKVLKISRVMYEKHVGKIPDGLCVLHHCDNILCVNPDHLFVGTQRDNCMDMMAKGRHGHGGCKGEKHPMAKLTDKKIEEIRNVVGHTISEIAIMFNSSRSTICRVRKRQSWKHI